jgi:methylated-DNA-[protein]-cysteine S-methyltransferase
MYIDFIATPLGTLEIKASQLGVSSVIFSDLALDDQQRTQNKITNSCKQQLEEYFSGQRKKFDLPLDQQGTIFQKSVWACLLKIPFGQAASYQDIATMLENPRAVRAVGAANGKNPISIIVPCHRIIGSNKTLTGYAGGLERKSWLLKHEGINFK